MGSAIARAAVQQAMKQGGRAITKNISSLNSVFAPSKLPAPIDF